VPQASVLGPHLFNIFISDPWGVVRYSNYLLFADNIKIFHDIKNSHDSLLLQSDTLIWFVDDAWSSMSTGLELYFLLQRTILLSFDYKLCESPVTCTDSITDLEVLIDSKLHFHHHVDYIFSQTIRLLGLIRAVTFSSIQSSDAVLHVRPKLEYASVVWNSISCTDACKLEHIQRKFVFLCRRRFFNHNTITIMS
jgi:hypothetical protein